VEGDQVCDPRAHQRADEVCADFGMNGDRAQAVSEIMDESCDLQFHVIRRCQPEFCCALQPVIEFTQTGPFPSAIGEEPETIQQLLDV
jgi:hypothetical protein